MIEELVKETVEILEADFYKKKFKFSYSSISKLLYSPTVFYQIYVLGYRPEEREKHLVNGSLIHLLLLEPENFASKYIVSPTNIPKDPAKLIVETVFYKNKKNLKFDSTLGLEDFEYSILDTLVAVNLHQSLKEDQSRIDKILIEQNKSYFEFLKNKEGLELIDESTLKYCTDAVETIKSTPGVKELIGLDIPVGSNIEVFNELYLEMEMNDFGLKGYIDNIVIDHDNKMIQINDIKTSSKSLIDFEESIEFWNYWMQAAIYIQLVIANYPDLVAADYEFKFTFLVIDKYYNVYPFHVTDKTAQVWYNRFMKETLVDIKYHYNNHDYNLPAKFAQGLVKL